MLIKGPLLRNYYINNGIGMITLEVFFLLSFLKFSSIRSK